MPDSPDSILVTKSQAPFSTSHVCGTKPNLITCSQKGHLTPFTSQWGQGSTGHLRILSTAGRRSAIHPEEPQKGAAGLGLGKSGVCMRHAHFQRSGRYEWHF